MTTANVKQACFWYEDGVLTTSFSADIKRKPNWKLAWVEKDGKKERLMVFHKTLGGTYPVC